MSALQGEGLVLRVVEFGESDRIVHLLTPQWGRVAAIAKGARRSVKRFPGTLDLFNHLRLQLDRRRRVRTGTGMARLEQAALVTPFAGLRRQAARYALASYLVELLDRLAPEGGDRGDQGALFDFAAGALRTLERQSPDRRLRILLELRSLDALGLRPELRACVRCGRPVSEAGASLAGFHVAEGGPVCGACGVRVDGLLPVHLGTLRALEGGLRLDLGQLDRLVFAPVALDEAARLLHRFQRFHVGLELRSERFLDEILPASAAAAG